ncbi:hypothetical protein FRC04_009402 [Tulasnella sp. 424]|nr:hypothetical protein FRC04_009402 [Tulasnella sp. 424]KAG8971849.1 hypothetical protein FRC05_010516 [Tulasnella sp. 425]
MKLSTTAFAASLLALSATAATAPEARGTTCYTLHTGYLAVFPKGIPKGVTLNSQNEVVYGKSGNSLKVEFQACPKLPGNSDPYLGRIVSNGKCLTIENPTSATEPYYAKLVNCGSNTTPSAAQTWRYGTGDVSGNVFWAGPTNAPEGIGYMSADDGTPLVTETNVLKIGCDHQCVSFEILSKLN